MEVKDSLKLLFNLLKVFPESDMIPFSGFCLSVDITYFCVIN